MGVLTDMRIERDQTDIECFPDAAVSVRGLGRLHMRRCTVQYIYPSTFTPVNSKTFGVHIDFGGVARLHDSKFFDTPGPCIKVAIGCTEVSRCVFVLPRLGPPILATRGFVRVSECTSLQTPFMRAFIWIFVGVQVQVDNMRFATIRKMQHGIYMPGW